VNKMANVYVSGVAAIAGDGLANHWMQAGNLLEFYYCS